jgi:hypothetical protein
MVRKRSEFAWKPSSLLTTKVHSSMTLLVLDIMYSEDWYRFQGDQREKGESETLMVFVVTV